MIVQKLKDVFEKFRCIREHDLDNGDHLYWYVNDKNIILVQEYAGDNGCEVFIGTPNDIDKTISEMYGNKVLDMEWFVRNPFGLYGNWGRGENIRDALIAAKTSPNDAIHLSVVSRDWELDDFGTLNYSYGKSSKPFQMREFVTWGWILETAASIMRKNGFDNDADRVDRVFEKLEDLECSDDGHEIIMPWPVVEDED